MQWCGAYTCLQRKGRVGFLLLVCLLVVVRATGYFQWSDLVGCYMNTRRVSKEGLGGWVGVCKVIEIEIVAL